MLINPATRTSLGLAETDGPTFAHLHLTDLAAITTIAESWLGPSSTTGIYFKAGNVGIVTTTPGAKLDILGASGSTMRIVSAAGTIPAYMDGQAYKGLYITTPSGSGDYPGIETVDTIGTHMVLAGNTFGTLSNDDLRILTNSQDVMRITKTGNVGIGLTVPTAKLHLKAGTATASTAPLKFTSGPVLSSVTSEAGAVEFLTDDLSLIITTGPARKGFVLNDGTNLTSGKIPIASTNGRLIDGQTPLAGTKVYYVSDTSGGAVTRKLTFTAGILTAET